MAYDPTVGETVKSSVQEAVKDVFETQKTRRKLHRWRILAIVLAVIVVIGAVSSLSGPSGPRIARLTVEGMIMEDAERDQILYDIADDVEVEALIVAISSPGGTAAGSEDLYNALRAVAAKKPVVATMGTVAASGGYITAIGADYIFARKNSLTASIGVIFQVTRFGDLMRDVGVEVDSYTSGPLKGEPSPFAPASDEGRALMDSLVKESYLWFKTLVGERRGLEGAALDIVADGRVMMGTQALEAGLVDAIGNEADAQAWLSETQGLDAELPVIDVTPTVEPSGLFATASAALSAWTGIKPLETKRLFVDGLAVLWHPSLSN